MQIETGPAPARMTSDELSLRLWQFAVRVGKVGNAFPDTRLGRHVAGQLVRSSTSAAPNYDEACAAEKRADFVHKPSVALKEQRETCGWLRFVLMAGLQPEKRIAPFLDEGCQLASILGRPMVSAKSGRRLIANATPPAL